MNRSVSRSFVVATACSAAFAATACDQPSTSETTTTAAQTDKKLNPDVPSVPAETLPKTPPTTPAWQAKLAPDMKKVLDKLATLGGKPIETLSPADARQQPTMTDAAKALLTDEKKSTEPIAMAKVEEKTIPSAAGAIPVRVYTPKGGKAPYPVIVYFHGGGFVIATNDTYDASARALADGANAVVESVEYRKAPEAKFPAAHDDALAAYEWTTKNAASIGGDPKKIALAGESAGGNLALATAIAARDKKDPLPTAIVAIYPVASKDMGSSSYVAFADAKPLDAPMMKWFTQQYFRTPADAADPRIDLVDANLAGLPPTTIINAGIDPLLSDGSLLGDRLKAAHVPTEQRTYDGVTHEFFGLGNLVGSAKDAEAFAVSRLKNSFGS
jgi:acetyl esterase/lipase